MTTHNNIQRKKPQAKNNTWSCSSSFYYLNTLNQQPNFTMSTTPIEERINSYEHKYQSCMQSRTLLSHWIKKNKEKGPPEPLTEGYSPPSRSRLPDFLFSSLSTRPKRKCEQPTAISSLSTFLKKATNYNKNTTTTTTTNQHHRFSLTSSLNRFSLQKNSYNNITEKYNSTIEDCRHRFSISPPDDKKQDYMAEMMISASDVTHNKKQRPQSSILPHSPSSVFLDRLRSRTPSQDGGEKPCHSIQPNTASKFVRIITHGDFIQDENITPPSSPCSTDSSFTPPLVSQFNHHHYLRQSGKSVTPEKKKKRASLLITPSLSTIRLLPQKSHFLKRQSMLA